MSRPSRKPSKGTGLHVLPNVGVLTVGDTPIRRFWESTSRPLGVLSPNLVPPRTKEGPFSSSYSTTASVKNNLVVIPRRRLCEEEHLVSMWYPSHGSYRQVSVKTSVKIRVKFNIRLIPR